MAIRRRSGLIIVGIAALLLLALTIVGPALIKVDRYSPGSPPISRRRQESRSKSGDWHTPFFLYPFILMISA